MEAFYARGFKYVMKKSRTDTKASRQRGTSLVEYTLMMGIAATLGVSAIRVIGGAIAGDSDPCNPGVVVKAARLLGDQKSLQLTCQQPLTQ